MKGAGLAAHSDRGSQHLAIRCTERLAEAGIEPSVGSVGDSFGNALAETINGLCKTEVMHRRGPWRSFEAVEYATLERVDWFNNRRLLEPIGNIPPAEAEAIFYAAMETPEMAAQLTRQRLRQNRRGSAACFPDLWPTHEAAKKDGQRKGTNGYYRDLYNSRMSPSSARVSYRPTGAGHRSRVARVDLARIPDPEAWLTNRLGPLAGFKIRHGDRAASDAAAAERLATLAFRLIACMRAVLATRCTALDALSTRLEAAKPAVLRRPEHWQPQQETVA